MSSKLKVQKSCRLVQVQCQVKKVGSAQLIAWGVLPMFVGSPDGEADAPDMGGELVIRFRLVACAGPEVWPL